MYRCARDERISLDVAFTSLTPEKYRLYKIIDQSIWSDETEMLAKLIATIVREPKWEIFLPVRFQHSLRIAVVPTGAKLKAITRKVSASFDQLARMIQGMMKK